MKIIIKYCLSLLIILFNVQDLILAQNVTTGKNILIVKSQTDEDGGSGVLANSLRFNLGKVIPDINIKELSLSDSNYTGGISSKEIERIFKGLSPKSFDLIITVDEPALKIINLEKQKYFPRVPLLFVGVKNFYDSVLQDRQQSTGVVHNINFKKLIENFVTIHQSLKRIVFILDENAKTSTIETIEDASWSYSSALKIDIYKSFSINDIRKLEKEKKDFIVILLGKVKNDDNQYLTLENSTLVIEKRLDVPIYTNKTTTIKYGATGCFVPNNFSQIADAFKIASKILKGENVSKIPTKQNNNFRLIYNYYQLTKYNIDPELLPAGVVIMNKPKTFYDEYGDYVWIVSIAFCILSLTIVFLILNTKRRMLIQRQLILSERKFRSFIEQSTDGIALMNEGGLVIEWNKGLENITGLTKEYVINKEQWAIQAQLLPDFLQKDVTIKSFKQEIADFLKTGQGEWLNTLNDVLIQNKEKGVIYAQQLVFPIKTEKGFMAGSITRDVTNLKLAEQELIAAKEEAERSDRLKSEFLAQMSHEVRTPINAILSFASLINEQLKENGDEEIQEYFDTIDSGARRLIRTIDLILNMAEVKAGNYAISLAKIDLAKDIIDKVIKDFHSTATQKNITFTFTRQTDDGFVQGDNYTIAQIFNALVENAFKYTKEGSVEIILFRDEKEQVCVEVKDTGIGISPEYMPKLFSAFSQEQTGYTRGYDGTGLGLALAKNYADLNNADIVAKSKKGVGTSFTVIFKN